MIVIVNVMGLALLNGRKHSYHYATRTDI
ncbi:hypothetical protein BCK_03945 [Bacillus cereus FRI-35]|nr:hypothetical protein BCK_03945 [Bacillus cereus FRI-35]AHZ49726.1 hypothetical protein YBT1520_04870 [Bacillus thuringiensis serovar kurstaki str. YBT-1520]AIE32100.1 hypothetical protein BTK_04895 [Bacillus thuringiensis serovar kurstaki str. HD-1]ETE97130.1 hypothetical protein C623_0215610 [Bacillus thuringiensis serovar aizawai str. Hu4-2]QDD82086.1 hypothetical protein FORC087_0783 [Bacillus cereus]